MPFFTKHQTILNLPIISPAATGKLEVQTVRLARTAMTFKKILTEIPGLMEYGQKVLVPQLVAPLMLQRWETALKVLTTDAVVGATFIAMVKVATDTINAEKA